MDASILDKMKYYNLGTFYRDAHHMDHPMNTLCPYCNALLSKGEKSSLCCRNGCIHLIPLPEYPEATWNLYFQNGTDGTFISDNFRAINLSYAMSSVNKEAERGTINGSIFRPHISIMVCTHVNLCTTSQTDNAHIPSRGPHPCDYTGVPMQAIIPTLRPPFSSTGQDKATREARLGSKATLKQHHATARYASIRCQTAKYRNL
jgi:hypothetical protein